MRGVGRDFLFCSSHRANNWGVWGVKFSAAHFGLYSAFPFSQNHQPISIANKPKDYCFWKLFLIPRIASSFSKLTSCFQASAISISKFVKVSITLLKAARSIRESYIQNATALTTGTWERAATIATLQLCNSTATTGISAARYCNYIATITTAASVTDSRQAFTLFNPQLAFQFEVIESREIVVFA